MINALSGIVVASLAAGITTALLGVAKLVFVELHFFSNSGISVENLFWSFTLFLGLGSFFAGLLLVPLTFVQQRMSLLASAIVFVAIGVSITMCFYYNFMWLSNRGYNPFEGVHHDRRVFLLFFFGVIGGAASLSSWIVLKKISGKRDDV